MCNAPLLLSWNVQCTTAAVVAFVTAAAAAVAIVTPAATAVVAIVNTAAAAVVAIVTTAAAYSKTGWSGLLVADALRYAHGAGLSGYGHNGASGTPI